MVESSTSTSDAPTASSSTLTSTTTPTTTTSSPAAAAAALSTSTLSSSIAVPTIFLGSVTGVKANITTLNLSEKDNLVQLDDNVGKLTSLTTLTINETKLTRLPSRGLSLLSSLRMLNLSGNAIKSLPENLGLLSCLVVFEVRSNAIGNLPSSTFSLTQSSLTEVDIAHNKIRALPETLGHLPALRHLFAGDNLIRCIPRALEGCSTLINVMLENNEITLSNDIDGGDGDGDGMNSEEEKEEEDEEEEEEDDSQEEEEKEDEDSQEKEEEGEEKGREGGERKQGNKENGRKEAWKEGNEEEAKECQTGNEMKEKKAKKKKKKSGRYMWPHLHRLNLSCNRIKRLPECFFRNLRSLRTLDLTANRLVTLPKKFGSHLTNIETILLADNVLRVLPDSIGKLVRLTHITLNRNKLKEVPESIYGLTQLCQLNIGGNPIAPPSDSTMWKWGDSTYQIPDTQGSFRKILPPLIDPKSRKNMTAADSQQLEKELERVYIEMQTQLGQQQMTTQQLNEKGQIGMGFGNNSGHVGQEGGGAAAGGGGLSLGGTVGIRGGRRGRGDALGGSLTGSQLWEETTSHDMSWFSQPRDLFGATMMPEKPQRIGTSPLKIPKQSSYVTKVDPFDSTT